MYVLDRLKTGIVFISAIIVSLIIGIYIGLYISGSKAGSSSSTSSSVPLTSPSPPTSTVPVSASITYPTPSVDTYVIGEPSCSGFALRLSNLSSTTDHVKVHDYEWIVYVSRNSSAVVTLFVDVDWDYLACLNESGVNYTILYRFMSITADDVLDVQVNSTTIDIHGIKALMVMEKIDRYVIYLDIGEPRYSEYIINVVIDVVAERSYSGIGLDLILRIK